MALRRLAPLGAALAACLLVWLTSATLRPPAHTGAPARPAWGTAVAAGKAILRSAPEF